MYNIVVNFQRVLNSKQCFLWECNLLIIQLFSTNGTHQSKNHNDLKKKLHQFHTNSFAFEPISIRLKRNREDTSCEIITHKTIKN